MKKAAIFAIILSTAGCGKAGDYNGLILEKLNSMPKAGAYAAYRKDLPEGRRFEDLHQTVEDLDRALSVDRKGRLEVKPKKAADHSFCSSATYLLFCDVIASLQREGIVAPNRVLSEELANVGSKYDVIAGKLDGVGIFGHWNADGPGTAVLFERLGLGRNFSGFENAKPGDFLKIFWNDSIGKGERGHLVVYLGESDDGSQVEVWSSNQSNADGSAAYGRMWVEKSRIKRVLFSRLENPENLSRWLTFSEQEKSSDYLIRIRRTGSSGEEMKRVTGSLD